MTRRGFPAEGRLRAELASQAACISRQRVRVSSGKLASTVSASAGGFAVITRPANDLVNRRLHVTGPNQRWVLGVTCVLTWMGSLHLAVVSNVWSRRVVACAVVVRMTADLVLAPPYLAL